MRVSFWAMILKRYLAKCFHPLCLWQRQLAASVVMFVQSSGEGQGISRNVTPFYPLAVMSSGIMNLHVIVSILSPKVIYKYNDDVLDEKLVTLVDYNGSFNNAPLQPRGDYYLREVLGKISCWYMHHHYCVISLT